MKFVLNPSLENYEDYHHVGVGEICVTDRHTPLGTHSLSTCSAVLAFDSRQSQHLMAHVMAGNHSECIAKTLKENFNVSSQTLEIIVVPGTGYTDHYGHYEAPNLSLSIIRRALQDLDHRIADNWYTNQPDIILLNNGLIQKGDYICGDYPTESLAYRFIRKPFQLL